MKADALLFQYMMAMKAHLMKDTETAERIMTATMPAEAKTLGRQVKNFNQAVSWLQTVLMWKRARRCR